MAPISFALFLVIALAASVRAQSDKAGCVFTDEACPCSEMASSGTCMNHIGGNKCLLGECTPSYRCDCFGYESCNRSRCSMFTTAKNTLPSRTVSFDCHLTGNAGVCTSFDSFLDTIEAADNSFSDAITSTEESFHNARNVHTEIEGIHEDIELVKSALHSIEPQREMLTAEEAEAIEKDSQVVMSTLSDVGRDAVKINAEAAMAFNASREVGELRRQAKNAEREAKETELKLNGEETNAQEEGKVCVVCDKLKEDIVRLRQLRKESATNAGKKARGSRENRKKAAEGLKETEKKRMSSAEARDRVLARIEKLRMRAESENPM